MMPSEYFKYAWIRWQRQTRIGSTAFLTCSFYTILPGLAEPRGEPWLTEVRVPGNLQ